MVAPGPGRAVGRSPCWPLQCLMCRWSALSSAGLGPAVSVFVSASALPSAGAAASGSRGHTQYHCGLKDIFDFSFSIESWTLFFSLFFFIIS